MSRVARLRSLPSVAVAAVRERWRSGGLLRVLTDAPLLFRQSARFLRGAPPLPPESGSRQFLPPESRYDSWLRVNQFTERDADELRRRLAQAGNRLPVLSVVMPVYKAHLGFLQKALQSVSNQVYDRWELCIADDGSEQPELQDILRQWQQADARIRITFRSKRGHISACSNDAAASASGDFLVFLDQDDELTVDALGEIALALSSCPDADLVYSDDDKIDVDGRRYDPQFKADWSPELLLSYMYFSHAFVIRRSLFESLSGFRSGYEGSQDHDLALRAAEHTQRVLHIPKVLYHWRAMPGSIAHTADAKPGSIAAGQHAVQDALNRRGLPATATQAKWAAAAGLGIFEHCFPDDGPAVTIIIPTCDPRGRLQTCLRSLQLTTYRNVRVSVVDTSKQLVTRDEAVLRWPLEWLACPQDQFNFSALVNLAVERASTDYVLLLNDDTEIIDPSWLSQMMGYAQAAGVGAVGAKLIYPDDRVQHAGVVHGYHYGLAGHAFKLSAKDDPGYLWQASVVRNCSAVSAACLLVRRDIMRDHGGFDERTFGVAYNDVDFCYRLGAAGYRIVFCPAPVRHVEGASRGFVDNPAEVAQFRARYRGKRDAYHSPHLSLESERYQIQPRRLLRSAPIERRLALFGNAFDLTGAPLLQLELWRELRKLGFSAPWAHANNPGPLEAAFRTAGVSEITTGHPLSQVGADITRYQESIDTLASELSARQIDAVYANTFETFYAVDAAARAGIPSIWSVHESEPVESYFERFGVAIEQRALETFALPYRVVFSSARTQQAQRGVETRHNFTVIPSGLDGRQPEWDDGPATREATRSKWGAGSGECVFLQVGTICERKSQLDLIEAFAILPDDVQSNIRIVLVGDRPGAYSDRLHHRVADLPSTARDRILVVSETRFVADYYRAADVFVCTSRVESYPRVILEAMGYGLAILTTPVFGIREQVQPGVNGLFFDPGNHRTLARQVAELASRPEKRRAMAARSPEVLAGLTSFAEMTEAYAEAFHEAASTRS